MEASASSHCEWTKYRRQQCIGAGTFGQVYIAEGIPEAGGHAGRHVVKSVHISDLNDRELRAATNEVQVLSLLQHANVVRYHDHFVDKDGFLNIVMEYCTEGDLAQLIERRKEAGDPFTEPQVSFMAFQLLQAMKYIHSINIIHRDLKPANIFLTKDHTLKIADFGISKLVGTSSVAQTVVGTPFYLSPEICENRPYNHSADVWSAGCVIYEIAALEKAFAGSNILAVVRKVTEGRYQPLPGRYRKVSALLGRMLVVDPQDRAPVSVLVAEFFTGGIAALPTEPLTSGEDPCESSGGDGGITPSRVEKAYVQWNSELQCASQHGAPARPSGSPERSPGSRGGPRRSGGSAKGSGPGRARRGRTSKGKAQAKTAGVTEARMPELEFHLLPSQKCLLLGEEQEAEGRCAEQVVFRRDRGHRPVERSGRRPSDSFAAAGSGEVLDAARQAAAAVDAGVHEDDYCDDFEREHDDASGDDHYSDDSFEHYDHASGEEGAPRGQHAQRPGRGPSPIRLSEADVDNIRRALEIDQTTARQTQRARMRCSELSRQQAAHA